MKKQVVYLAPLLLLILVVGIGNAQGYTEDSSPRYIVDQPILYNYFSLNETINFQTSADFLDCIYLIEGKKGDWLSIWANTDVSTDFIAMDTQGLLYWLGKNVSEGDSLANHVLWNNTMFNATQYNTTCTFPQDTFFCLVIQPSDLNMSMSGYIGAIRISQFDAEANVTRGSSLADRIEYGKALDSGTENVSMANAPV